MRLLLLRHGPAVDPYAAPSDHMRWLTDQGRARMRSVGRALAELGLRYTCIYTSPLVRAVQTAEILASESPGFLGPVKAHPPLSPDRGSSAQALSPLQHAEEGDLLVLIGHEPKIRILAGHISGLSSFPAFRAGAACLLEHDGRKGRFLWMMDPESLDRALEVGEIRP